MLRLPAERRSPARGGGRTVPGEGWRLTPRTLRDSSDSETSALPIHDILAAVIVPLFNICVGDGLQHHEGSAL
jgi:hypothetical protein